MNRLVLLLVWFSLVGTGISGEPVTDVKELSWLVGEWTTSQTLNYDGREDVLGPKGIKTTSTRRFRWALEKTALVTEKFHSANGKTMNAMVGVIAVDPRSNAVVRSAQHFSGDTIGRWYRSKDSKNKWFVQISGWRVEAETSYIMEVEKLDSDTFTSHFINMVYAGESAPDRSKLTYKRVSKD